MKAKKIWAILLSLAVLIGVMPMAGLMIGAAQNTVKTVYVSASGDDNTADGTNAATPYATINAAITALDASDTTDDRVIIIQGNYTVNGTDAVSTYPAFVPHENLITIKGDEGALIDLTGVVSVGGPIKFDDITYTFTNNNAQICASGYPVEFGAGAAPLSSSNRGRVHSGGYHSQLRTDYETRVHNLTTSSDFYFVWLGEANPNGKKYTVPGVNYVMNGGWVGRLAIGANTADTARANYFTGNVNIELNSGTVAQIRTTYSTLANYAPGVAVQIIANNGFVLNWTSDGSTVTGETPVLRDDDGKENLYVIKSAKGGSTLHATKDTGVYKIADPTYKAIATDGENTYTSQNGVLTVPAAGTYTVTWAQAEIEYASTVYVSENGSDESTVTGTQENPFKTINAAIDALNTVTANDKQIYILDKAELPAELAANTDQITITGDSGAQLLMTQNVTLGGDFVIGGVVQTHTAGSPQYRFMTNGHSVSFRGDMAYGTYPHIADVSLGKTNTNVGKVTLELNDVALYRVYTGSHYNTKDVTAAGADITINSGSVYRLFVGANGWAGAPGTTTYTENVNVIFNGGAIGDGLIRLSNVAAQERFVKFADGKALQVIFNNGKGGNITVVDNDNPNTPYVADHFYRLNCAEKVFLSPTPDTGVYKVDVPEGMFAIAKKDGKVAGYAADGELLRLGESGTYTVDYAESATYSLSEDADSGLVTLTVNIDFTIDFDTFAIVEKEGYIFNGWLDAEGNAVTNPALTSGTVLTAQYVAKKDNFYMVGTQIRPASANKEQALRFIVHLGKDFGINYTEKGTVVIPNTILGVKELVVGGNYVYSSKPYSAQSVVGEKLWVSSDDYVQYTAALTGITNYLTAYAARGYIKYTDLNGVVRYAYTDKTPAASLNEVAEMLLERDPDDKAAKQIADTAKTAVVSKYEGTISPLTSNVVFSSATSANTTVNNAIYDNNGVYTTSDNTAINFYKLNGKLSTLVTDVTIDAVGENGNLDPTTVMQLTDIHFTYADDVDVAENNIYTMTSWSQRQGNGTFFTSDLDFSNYRMQWILKALEYSAAVGDQTVVTGDMIDFISHGNLTLMNRVIAEPYSNSLMLVGNHEPVRLVSETASLSDPDKWSAEYYQILNKFWVDHDLTYSSKMVGKEVMVIQMDNSHYFFTQAQVDKLTADLAIAREKGYTVLVFTHIPFVPTDGASSQELLMGKGGFAVGPDDTADSYYIQSQNTNQSLIDGRNADWEAEGKKSFTPAEYVAATEAMYNLIVDNGDIIKGVFNGHKHNTVYSRLYREGGTVVPQYTLAASFIDGGVVMKITVR